MQSGSPIRYLSALPEPVEEIRRSGRMIITTPQGGQIVLDDKLFALYQKAQGLLLDEILNSFASENGSASPLRQHPDEIRAALACLVQAGIIRRIPATDDALPLADTFDKGLVSVIIVNFNSQQWLDECLPSLQAQLYQPLEIIIVDNGSTEDLGHWISNS